MALTKAKIQQKVTQFAAIQEVRIDRLDDTVYLRKINIKQAQELLAGLAEAFPQEQQEQLAEQAAKGFRQKKKKTKKQQAAEAEQLERVARSLDKPRQLDLMIRVTAYSVCDAKGKTLFTYEECCTWDPPLVMEIFNKVQETVGFLDFGDPEKN